jgi:hypothetical protein
MTSDNLKFKEVFYNTLTELVKIYNKKEKIWII